MYLESSASRGQRLMLAALVTVTLIGTCSVAAEQMLRTERAMSSSGQVLSDHAPLTRDMLSGTGNTYHNKALLDAYDKFGLNSHSLQNEFEIFKYADIKTLPDSDPHGHRELADSGDTYIITDVSPRAIWNDEMVTVSFYSSKPDEKDWIAAYSPPETYSTSTVPVKYGWCNDFSPTYLHDGTGTLTFNMTNLRADVRFVYVKGGYSHATHVNTSQFDLTYHNNNEQLRNRVVATGDPDVYTLMWSSASNTQPVIKWSTDKDSVLTQTSIDASTTFVNKTDLCGWPANDRGWRDMGLIHSASLSGMKALANTKIYYTFGDIASDTWSAMDGNGTTRIWDFYVPPLAGQQPINRPTTLVWFDDMGRGSNDQAYTWEHYGRASYNTTKSVGALVQTGAVDAIYHGGDISYAVGFEAVWDFFMDMLVPMSSSVLYFTTVGNHETDFPGTSSYYTGYDSGGECSVPALAMLPQPYKTPTQPATVDDPWWSYDVGLIHFIGLSSEHNFTTNSAQWLWLENDLKSVNRTLTPWVLFGAHRAMYISSSWGPNNDEGVFTPSSDIANMDLMVKHVEPLLWKYKVNLGLYGHMHCVQRQAAILEQRIVQSATMVKDSNGDNVATHIEPQSTVHYIVGTGGANLMESVNPVQPVWNELNFFKWGYAIIEAVDNTELTFRWVESSTEDVIDRMKITQADPALDSTPSTWACPGEDYIVCGNPTDDDPVTDDDGSTDLLTGLGIGGIALGMCLWVAFDLIADKCVNAICNGLCNMNINVKSATAPRGCCFKSATGPRGRTSTVEMLAGPGIANEVQNQNRIDEEARKAGEVQNPVHATADAETVAVPVEIPGIDMYSQNH